MRPHAWLALLLIGLGLGAPAVAAPPPHKVLFVCTGNYFRSRFAEALFNEARPKQWSAFSRGLGALKPRKEHVSPLVIAELKRRSVPSSRVDGAPQPLTQQDLDAAEVVVLMNGPEHEPLLHQQFPTFPLSKVRSWAIGDFPKMPTEQAFANIATGVDALIAELLKAR